MTIDFHSCRVLLKSFFIDYLASSGITTLPFDKCHNQIERISLLKQLEQGIETKSELVSL